MRRVVAGSDRHRPQDHAHALLHKNSQSARHLFHKGDSPGPVPGRALGGRSQSDPSPPTAAAGKGPPLLLTGTAASGAAADCFDSMGGGGDRVVMEGWMFKHGAGAGRRGSWFHGKSEKRDYFMLYSSGLMAYYKRKPPDNVASAVIGDTERPTAPASPVQETKPRGIVDLAVVAAVVADPANELADSSVMGEGMIQLVSAATARFVADHHHEDAKMRQARCETDAADAVAVAATAAAAAGGAGRDHQRRRGSKAADRDYFLRPEDPETVGEWVSALTQARAAALGRVRAVAAAAVVSATGEGAEAVDSIGSRDAALHDLLRGLLEKDAERRLELSELPAHSWLSGDDYGGTVIF